MYDTLEQYYRGKINLDQLTEVFRYRLGHPDITSEALKLSESSISPRIIEFMRGLHGHFLKIGIMGNLGTQEYQLLSAFNNNNKLFEIVASPMSLRLDSPLMSRAVFDATLKTIGEPADSCLLVSGNPYYLAFASSMGLYTLQFEGLGKLEESLNRMLTSETPSV
jgi:hypothetical protein